MDCSITEQEVLMYQEPVFPPPPRPADFDFLKPEDEEGPTALYMDAPPPRREDLTSETPLPGFAPPPPAPEHIGHLRAALDHFVAALQGSVNELRQEEPRYRRVDALLIAVGAATLSSTVVVLGLALLG